MNILALAFFIVAAIIFLLSVVTIMKERKNKIIIGLHSQIFIINITAFILSVLAVFQQFVSQTLASVIDQFIAIFFVLVVINLAHVVIIIWDINKGKKEVTKNSITIVLLFLFIEFIILGSSWTALYFYKNSGDIILDQYKDYLYSVANSRASHIGSLILDYKNKALADSTLNLGMINCLEDIESNGGECSKEQLDEVIKERLNSKLDKIYLMVILDKNGKIVSSSDNSLVGEDWSSRQSFINHTSDGYFSDIF
jgi:glucan phosphoethanolaminetransferase (alkaline phosphatase superfamily)